MEPARAFLNIVSGREFSPRPYGRNGLPRACTQAANLGVLIVRLPYEKAATADLVSTILAFYRHILRHLFVDRRNLLGQRVFRRTAKWGRHTACGGVLTQGLYSPEDFRG